LATLNTTASLPFKVVGVVPETALSDGTFVELYVQYNAPYFSYNSGTPASSTMAGGHLYNQPTGV
jgi:hypothetical protein